MCSAILFGRNGCLWKRFIVSSITHQYKSLPHLSQDCFSAADSVFLICFCSCGRSCSSTSLNAFDASASSSGLKLRGFLAITAKKTKQKKQNKTLLNIPRGRSDGILLGINLEVMEVASIDEGEFYVKFHVRNKEDGFQWILVAVYGAAQEEFKEDFLVELVNACNKEPCPLLVGGDFNIIRNPSEKNNDRYNDKWPFLFNVVIDSVNLRELELSGRKFTWASSMQNPTFEKLDRVLTSTEWELRFPLATVRALNREFSDHTPLLLDTGSGTQGNKQPLFKFELGWLLREGFLELVTEVWRKESRGSTKLEKWQNKIRRLRQFLRGWAKNINGAYKKEKAILIAKVEELDKKAESQLLSRQELDLKNYVKQRLSFLLREEEIKWLQRAKTKRILEGDRNTKYYHLIANGKHRKTRIFQLEQEEGVIRGDVQIKKYITKFYKDLFGAPVGNNFSLMESQREDIPQVSEEENEVLTKSFSDDEVK